MAARCSGGGAPVGGGAGRQGGTSASRPRVEARCAVGGGGHGQMRQGVFCENGFIRST